MKTVAKRVCLLTGFLLAAILLPVQVASEARAPANQQENAAPKGQRLFYASHRSGSSRSAPPRPRNTGTCPRGKIRPNRP
jgi:hypothetical protein